MKKSRFTNSQIMSVLKQLESGLAVAELSWEHNVSTATLYHRDLLSLWSEAGSWESANRGLAASIDWNTLQMGFWFVLPVFFLGSVKGFTWNHNLDAPDLGLIMSTNKRKSQGATKAVTWKRIKLVMFSVDPVMYLYLKPVREPIKRFNTLSMSPPSALISSKTSVKDILPQRTALIRR